MARSERLARRRRPETRRAYELVVRGPDGRLRSEQFTNAAAYRARLMRLEPSATRSVSIDDIDDIGEIAALLDN